MRQIPVGKLVALLDDADSRLRYYALTILESQVEPSLPKYEIWGKVTPLLDDADPRVRHRAALCLSAMFHCLERKAERGGGGETPSEGDEMRSRRFRMVEILSPVRKALEKLVLSASPELANAAMAALAHIGSPASLPMLESLPQSHPASLMGMAVLASIGDERAVELFLAGLSEAAEGGSPHALFGALELPRICDVSTAVDFLSKLSTSRDPSLRAAAASACGAVGENALPIIAGGLLRDESWIVVQALRSLDEMGAGAVEELVGGLLRRHSDPFVLATALSCCRHAPGLSSDVEGMVVHDDERVAANAVETLGLLSASCVAGCWRRNDSPSHRYLANVVVACSRLDTDRRENVSILRELLGSQDEWAVLAAVYAMEHAESLPCELLLRMPLEQLSRPAWMIRRIFEAVASRLSAAEGSAGRAAWRYLASDSEDMRIGGAILLAETASAADLERLLDAFRKEGSPRVRSALVRALGRTCRRLGTYEPLLETLSDDDARVVADAVEYIGMVPDLRVSGVLNEYVGHPNNRVAANAKLASWRCGELGMIDELAADLCSGDVAGIKSALYVASQMGMDLRRVAAGGDEELTVLSLALERWYSSEEGSAVREGTPSVATGAEGGADGAEPAPPADEPSLAGVERRLRAYLAGECDSLEEYLGAEAEAAAYMAYRLGRRGDDAAGLLSRTAEEEPRHVTPLLELARLYASEGKGNPRQLRSYFMAALRKLENMSALCRRALDGLHASRLSSATELLRYLAANLPLSTQTHAALGRGYLRAGVVREALLHLRLAHYDNPREPSITLDYAVAAFKAGYNELARQLCLQITVRNEEDERYVELKEKAARLLDRLPG